MSAPAKDAKPELFTTDRDAEHFHCKSPEEAIREDCGTFDSIDLELRGSVTAYGYARHEISGAHCKRVAEAILEDAIEMHWDEEYGGDDGDGHPDPENPAFVTELADLIERWFKTGTVWQCSKVWERTYSPEEVEQIVKAGK